MSAEEKAEKDGKRRERDRQRERERGEALGYTQPATNEKKTYLNYKNGRKYVAINFSH